MAEKKKIQGNLTAILLDNLFQVILVTNRLRRLTRDRSAFQSRLDVLLKVKNIKRNIFIGRSYIVGPVQIGGRATMCTGHRNVQY